MLNVPTLWIVSIANFLALGLVWTYVLRSYPNFGAARFWAASSYVAALGAAASMLRTFHQLADPAAVQRRTSLIVAASCIASDGRVPVLRPAAGLARRRADTVLASFAGISFFLWWSTTDGDADPDLFAGRSVPIALTLKLVLSRQDGRDHPGARLSGIVAILIMAVNVMRAFSPCCTSATRSRRAVQSGSVGAGADPGFPVDGLFFGFLLMAIDRLRNEVADLALLDDLTGVGNRRHLLQRLTEECARSERSSEPFALLVIDLDGFKAINDTHGHAAGDACLQHFTLMAQTRLRPGDMLARTGGDEFCIVLPASTLREGAMIARRILEVCREDAAACVGGDIPISLSIGVAQWTREMGAFPDRLIAAADHALYAAKNDGKNRHAVYDPAPPLAPGRCRARNGAAQAGLNVLSGWFTGLRNHELPPAGDGARRHRACRSGIGASP